MYEMISILSADCITTLPDSVSIASRMCAIYAASERLLRQQEILDRFEILLNTDCKLLTSYENLSRVLEIEKRSVNRDQSLALGFCRGRAAS